MHGEVGRGETTRRSPLKPSPLSCLHLSKHLRIRRVLHTELKCKSDEGAAVGDLGEEWNRPSELADEIHFEEDVRSSVERGNTESVVRQGP